MLNVKKMLYKVLNAISTINSTLTNINSTLTNINSTLTNINSTLTNRDRINFTVGFESTSFSHPDGTGVWYVSNVSAGSPTSGNVWGMLLQMRSPFSVHSTTSAAVYTQVFFNVSNNNVYTRNLNNNSWSAWKTL